MRVLITGADCRLGQLAVAHFGETHDLRTTGTSPSAPDASAGETYRCADLRRPEDVAPLVSGIDAVLHLSVYDSAPLQGVRAEQERLDMAARGTYVLLMEARKAGVARVVLASTLSLFDTYAEDYVVDESWRPMPKADAESLAPYLGEMVCREFAREGGMGVVCLRLGPLGAEDGTPEQDAVEALAQALAMPMRAGGYRWHVYHISRDDRFPMRSVTRADFESVKEGRA